MTFKKKLIIKTIIIIVLSILISGMFLYFILVKLAVPRFPEESLKRALEFVEVLSVSGWHVSIMSFN